jgi:microcystin-dependent protein
MLNKAQLMDVPGGPGVVGAVQAGTGISIDTTTGVASLNTSGIVTKIIAGNGISVNPSTGIGNVTVSSTATVDIPSGSVTIFSQPAAPTGWTKLVSTDNAAIRVTSGSGGGTGGSNPFTSAFTGYTPVGTFSSANLVLNGSVGSSSVSTSQIASHSHNYESRECSPTGLQVLPGGNLARCTQNSQNSGSNQGHTHSFSGQIQGTAGFIGTATAQFTVKYIDAILCSKN